MNVLFSSCSLNRGLYVREIRQKCIHTLSSILNTAYSTLLHTKTKAAHKFYYYHTLMYEYQRFMRKIPEPEAMNRRIASTVKTMN